MNTLTTSRICGLLLATSTLFAAVDPNTTQTGAVRPAPARKPSIVFMMLDDVGYNVFGPYGGVAFETPNVRARSTSNSSTALPARQRACSLNRNTVITR